jgi:hypothetical protein
MSISNLSEKYTKRSTFLITNQDSIIILVARFLTIHEYATILAPVSFQFADINYENYCHGIEKYFLYEAISAGGGTFKAITLKNFSMNQKMYIYNVDGTKTGTYFLSDGHLVGRGKVFHENGCLDYMTMYNQDGSLVSIKKFDWIDTKGDNCCSHIMRSGKRKGKNCGKISRSGGLCSLHKKSVDKLNFKTCVIT